MEREPTTIELVDRILDDALTALDHVHLRYAVMGGIAATAFVGHRTTNDIDVFVRPDDAIPALEALEAAGFTTARTDPHWLYKAKRNGVTVDVIFRSAGSVYFDEGMIERSAMVEFRGRKIRVLSPEDLFVIKALVFNEHSLSLDEHCMRHLNDLLGIMRSCALDWDYVLRRARLGPRRVLGLLLFAQSLDLLVPNHVIKVLANMLEIC